tara:strand:- start:665 stop:1321 length:657 start_codon:yes stop_codon:yes gene_type:complete
MTETESEKFYNQIRNTYYYTLEASEGVAPSDEVNKATFRLPNLRFPEHQGSDRCIFRLTDFYITGCNAFFRPNQLGGGIPSNQNLGNIDISGFYVEIQGIGLQNQDVSTALSGGGGNANTHETKNTNVFAVFNEGARMNELTGGVALAGTSQGSGIMGQSNIDAYRVCGNPNSSDVIISVYSMDSGAPLANPTNNDIQWVIKFEVQVIPSNKGDPRRR